MDALETAIFRGTRWIVEGQTENGGFETNFGFRHDSAKIGDRPAFWSTAYVLNRLPVSDCSAFAKARELLMGSARSHPAYGLGWGYNANTLPDLDSTIEVDRALINQTADELDPIIFFHLFEAVGGFATYTVEDASKLNPGMDVWGWTSPHLEIATNLRQLSHTLGYKSLVTLVDKVIVNHLEKHGYQTYWYLHPLTAAGLVGESGISISKVPSPPLPTNPQQLDWQTTNNPFVMAMALEVAVRWDRKLYAPIIEFLTKRLIKIQRADGSWRPYLVLGVPYSDALNPNQIQHSNADFVQSVITTTRVLNALTMSAEIPLLKMVA